MTLKQARKLAILHGVPEDKFQFFVDTADTPKPQPKRILQACNYYIEHTYNRKRMNAFKRATNQKIPRGIPVKGHKKCVIAPYRMAHRTRHWHEVKAELFKYCYPNGVRKPKAIATVAKYIGCEPSQVHRWVCPICEHDAEPNFSVGMVIVEFLDEHTL